MSNNIYEGKTLTEKKQLLTKLTGHVLLEPENQYCEHCHEPMFVPECSDAVCEVGRYN